MKVNRCVSFNVFIQKEHESLRPKVREALALYRAVMAKLYAVAVIAEEAGAEIIADEKKGLQVKWSKRIVNEAVRSGCGAIQVFDLPENMFGRPWQMAQLFTCIEYKAKAIGLEVEKKVSPKVELEKKVAASA